MAVLKVACMLVMCMVVVAPYAKAAITCGQVVNNVIPCMSYLTNGGAIPAACCSGIQSLNSAAKTTVDRKTACNCLKSAAGGISGVNYQAAANLPGKCGVSIPYKISPTTDCSTIK